MRHSRFVMRAVSCAQHEGLAFQRQRHFAVDHIHKLFAGMRRDFRTLLSDRHLHEDRLELTAARHVRQAGEQIRRVREAKKLQLRSEEHTSELQSHVNLVCRLLLEKKKKKKNYMNQ